ncbi:hypothetical protein BDN72DRAFT_771328, partial [Pluteus cervinus]
MTKQAIKPVYAQHDITIPRLYNKQEISETLENHQCTDCKPYVAIFECKPPKHVLPFVPGKLKAKIHPPIAVTVDYPPEPVKQSFFDSIIEDYCNATKSEVLEEGGCTVCGQLKPLSCMTSKKQLSGLFGVLQVEGVAKIERETSSEPEWNNEPVVDLACDKVCEECRIALRKVKIPANALANGLWIGPVPEVLKDLRFVEKLLISKVRLIGSVVRVASGFHKMKAHVVAFENPIPKIYAKLPPPVTDLDDVLAILFTGPSKPTPEDYKRVPFLIRRNNVAAALEWLKVNHKDYHDIEIDYGTLQEYPEHEPPVTVQYKAVSTQKGTEETSLIDQNEEEGVDTGMCPFTVHGLTG